MDCLLIPQIEVFHYQLLQLSFVVLSEKKRNTKCHNIFEEKNKVKCFSKNTFPFGCR